MARPAVLALAFALLRHGAEAVAVTPPAQPALSTDQHEEAVGGSVLVRREQQPARGDAHPQALLQNTPAELPADHNAERNDTNGTNPDPLASLPKPMPDEALARDTDFKTSAQAYEGHTVPGSPGAPASLPLYDQQMVGGWVNVTDTQNLTGPQGPPGPDGPEGDPGVEGIPGPPGKDGALHIGPAGPIGVPGHVGPPGQRGEAGPVGPAGKRGFPADGERQGQEMIFIAADLLRKVDAVTQAHDEGSTYLLTQIRLLEKQLGIDVDETRWAEEALKALQGKGEKLNHTIEQLTTRLNTIVKKEQGVKAAHEHEAETLHQVEDANRDLEESRYMPSMKSAAPRAAAGLAAGLVAMVVAFLSL